MRNGWDWDVGALGAMGIFCKDFQTHHTATCDSLSPAVIVSSDYGHRWRHKPPQAPSVGCAILETYIYLHSVEALQMY